MSQSLRSFSNRGMSSVVRVLMLNLCQELRYRRYLSMFLTEEELTALVDLLLQTGSPEHLSHRIQCMDSIRRHLKYGMYDRYHEAGTVRTGIPWWLHIQEIHADRGADIIQAGLWLMDEWEAAPLMKYAGVEDSGMKIKAAN